MKVYGYYIWYQDHLAGDNGEIDFNTKEEAEEDAKEYIKKGLMEEYYENDENCFQIEIISYNID